MDFFERNLLPDEHVLFRTKKHLIIFFLPVLLTILSVYVFYQLHEQYILNQMAWIPGLITAVLWCYFGLEYLTSAYVVTDKRVMLREGFFTRHSNEVRLSTISQVTVDQSLLGQLLSYGAVSINAFGASDVYPLISHPFEFQKTVNQELNKLVK
jgi:uncharacterized membrane protein YdbT with pleckstrin-like domain